MQRLFQLLAELAWHCQPRQRHVVETQLERLITTVDGHDFDSHELADFDRAAGEVRGALARDGRNDGAAT